MLASSFLVSVVALMPLCENMISGRAVKPGDVATAMNGKTIQVRLLFSGGMCVTMQHV